MWTSTLKKGLFLIGGLFLGEQYMLSIFVPLILWKEQVHACS